MLISICVLGGTPESLNFISKFKELPYYKKRDSDTEGVRIHATYIEDENLLNTPLVHRYQMANGNFANVSNDGYQETKKESSIGNDLGWLLESNGHDTIVEAVDNADKYLDTLISLIKKGYKTYITNKDYAENHWEVLEKAATDGGTTVTYCDNIYNLLGLLDEWYLQKLASQRKTILEDSYNAPQCGLQ